MKTKKNIIIYILLLGAAIFWGQFPSSIFMFAYKLGLDKPVLQNVSIELKEGWYPSISTEKGIGRFIFWMNQKQKNFEGVTFTKFDDSSKKKTIHFLKVVPEKKKIFNAKITNSKSYPINVAHWGKANILYKKSDRIGIYVKDYGLIIEAQNISLFDEIKEIKSVSNNKKWSLISTDIFYLLIGCMLLLVTFLTILKDIKSRKG